MTTATRRHRRPGEASVDASAIVPIEELTLLSTWHPNVMITGPAPAIQLAIGGLRPIFRTPVREWQPGRPLADLAIGQARTLILNDASALTGDDQRVLQSWLEPGLAALQVVTTSSVPLLPRVATGQFDAALYYALNVIYLDLFESTRPGFVGSTPD
jgi:hypothetical protein